MFGKHASVLEILKIHPKSVMISDSETSMTWSK
jgi:hypothetical protein